MHFGLLDKDLGSYPLTHSFVWAVKSVQCMFGWTRLMLRNYLDKHYVQPFHFFGDGLILGGVSVTREEKRTERVGVREWEKKRKRERERKKEKRKKKERKKGRGRKYPNVKIVYGENVWWMMDWLAIVVGQTQSLGNVSIKRLVKSKERWRHLRQEQGLTLRWRV